MQMTKIETHLGLQLGQGALIGDDPVGSRITRGTITLRRQHCGDLFLCPARTGTQTLYLYGAGTIDHQHLIQQWAIVIFDQQRHHPSIERYFGPLCGPLLRFYLHHVAQEVLLALP